MPAPSVFFSYSHADEAMRDRLGKQLSMLRREKVIEDWHDRKIGAGEDFGRAIDEHLNDDDIILLLVSPDFIHSDYCYDIEMRRAMERHEAGEAIVIPVILRACEWQRAPFGKLNATPRDGTPIDQWQHQDEAMLQVAKAVRAAAERWQSGTASAPAKAHALTPVPGPASSSASRNPLGPRTSNLRLPKTFTDRDKDKFKEESFDFVASFFENSLADLSQHNPGFEGVFRRVDAGRFFAKIYRHGNEVAAATIYTGGGVLGNGITFVQGETTASNSMNETISVEADDQQLFLRSLNMSSMGLDRNAKLSQEDAAEQLWGLLIRPLQHAGRW